MNPRTLRPVAAAAATAALLAACAAGDEPAAATWSPDDPVDVTLITHDSFVIEDDVVASLADEGIELQLLRGGDAGSMVNQAILTVDDPQADVLFGIDSTLLSRGLDAGLFEAYRSPELDAVPESLRLDPADRVTPIDVSDVCINYEVAAYDDELAPPSTLDDLADPAYAGQLVVQNPATSSPGLAFLLRTVEAYGEDGWQDYWRALVDNDVQVTAGWEDAYYGVFSGASDGDRPLVVSYSTSPPAEVLFGPDPEATEAPTAVLTESCYRQVEFAGVLANADQPAAARRVVDVLLSPEFQADVPLTMFVEPARQDVELPEVFVRFADRPEQPAELDPRVVEENRERWIEEWTELVLG